jgi:sugar/nucleoside kinase (ribokinase family)
MTAMTKPVVCVGILVADVLGRPIRSMPDPGRLVLVDEMSLHTGGCAVNSASALARLGLPAEVIGKVGTDPFGEFVISTLQKRGVGTHGIKLDREVGTSVTMVLVDPDGERRFFHYIGANASLLPDDIDLGMVKSAAIIHIGGALVLPGIDGEPTAILLKQARQAGVITFLDTVWDATGRWMEVLQPCMQHLDYFIPSLPEAQAITGLSEPHDVAHALIKEGPSTIVLKMGAEGCLVLTKTGELIRIPAYQVTAIDSTGAGDAFAAGFIAGVWLGWSLEKTARLANAVGAMCVTGTGASGAIRSLDETLKFMEDTSLRTI